MRSVLLRASARGGSGCAQRLCEPCAPGRRFRPAAGADRRTPAAAPTEERGPDADASSPWAE